MSLIIFTLFFITNPTSGLIIYDCGAKTMNITTLSLLDVDQCDIPDQKINITNQYIQLLEINDYQMTNVIQCKIEIRRIVYYRGMHSHSSIVKGGDSEYIHETSEKA